MEDITTYIKEKQIRSKTKTMLTAFFDVEGLVHHEFLSKGSAFEMQSVTNRDTDVRLVRGICSLTMCRFQRPKVSGSFWSNIALQLKIKKPTRCHLLFYFTSYRLDMFRELLCPSSGA